jgi:Family of unknown function (DUF6131)
MVGISVPAVIDTAEKPAVSSWPTQSVLPRRSPERCPLARPRPVATPWGVFMITLGIILLIVGFLAKIAILWTIGIILLVVGAVLFLLGQAGRQVGGRRHYW